MGADGLSGALGNDGTNVCGLVKRITQLVVGQDLLYLFDKVVVNLLININALNAATTLARVEDGTVDDFFCGPCQIDIGSDVCGILST